MTNSKNTMKTIQVKWKTLFDLGSKGLIHCLRHWHFEQLKNGQDAVASIELFGKHFVYIGEAQLIQDIFDNPKTFDKSQTLLRPMREATLDNGLATAPMPQWRQQKPAISSAFRGSLLMDYRKIMTVLACEMIEKQIRPAASTGQPVDIDLLMEETTSLVLAKTMMNIEGELIVPFEKVREISDSVDFIYNYNFLCYFLGQSNLLLKPLEHKYKRAKDHIIGIGTKIVDDYSDYMEIRGIREGFDIVSNMIAGGMSYQETVANLLTFIVGGFDTSKSLIKTLLRHSLDLPNRQTLRAEISSLDAFDDKEILNLPYLDAFVQEALRIESPAYLLMREVTRDCQLGDYYLSKGTTIIFSQHVMHHDPRYWHRPAYFEAERELHHAGAFFPFGAGARKCIGTKFGTMEVKILFASLFQEFDWHILPGKDEPDYGIVYQRPLALQFKQFDSGV